MKPNTIVLGFLDSDARHADDFAASYSPYATQRFQGVFPEVRRGGGEEEAEDGEEKCVQSFRLLGVIDECYVDFFLRREYIAADIIL